MISTIASESTHGETASQLARHKKKNGGPTLQQRAIMSKEWQHDH